MLSAFIPSELGYPAMLLVKQLVHHRFLHPGPLVLGATPLKYLTPDKEFRYLRTVIVTAAVHWGLSSELLI